nr:PREDICTED: sialic acid-binding Ig-like lectin 12 [Pundamilia nyererei]
MGRGATSQNGLMESSMVKTLEMLTAAVNTQNNTSERLLGYIKERPAQNNTFERKLDYIVEQLTAVMSSQNRLSEQKNDKTTELSPMEASSWTVKVPSSVKGHLGLCVVIPCSYDFPSPQNKVSEFTGIWYNDNDQVICHSNASQILDPFLNRTKLLGDLSKKNCSLMIENLQQSDGWPFYFRIEIKDYNQYSYINDKVSISLSQPNLSVQEEIKEGENVSASCSVFHSCPTYPPSFIWSHSGEQHDQTQQLHEDGPDIKTSSKCSSEDGVVKCECTVESEPPSMVHFVLGDRVLQSSKAEKNGSVTIETLQTDFGSFRKKNREHIPSPDIYANDPVYGNIP